MAVQSATALYNLLTLAAVGAAQAVPAASAAKNPIKGQYNMPGRMAGWEDYSKVRALMKGLVLGGTVTALEITIVQFFPDATPVATPIGKLVLANGVIEPKNLGMVGPGGYAAYVNLITGTAPTVSGTVALQAFNDDE